ncbi:MAG: glucose-6-phosphate dehydrogenase [Actinomycetota bacterium]|nr:glucose-6-phosphate dehydrogenase [Actinomycetota bacterium]
MIERLVLFGATGDLAGRYLLPALAALQAAGRLPGGFTVTGASRENMHDVAFRRSARERLEQHAGGVPATAREAVVRSLRYRPADVGDAESVASVIEPGGPVAAYLALPPRLFPAAVTALGRVRLPAGSRIVLEKPFGEDLQSAIALNRLLAETLGPAGEQAVFRVDHVLGMATVQNLLTLRLANRFLDAVWNSDHVEQVEILWEETLALEGRAGYYDRAGALKDVLQNHMLQLLALIAMEPPAGLEARDLHDRKLEALRSVRPLTRADVARRTRRARYTGGRLATGEDVPSYAEEDGVEPERETETFAEVAVGLESERWAGTRFLLRAGKALRRRRKMAIVRFRPAGDEAGELRIGVDGPEDLGLQLTGGAPESPARLRLSATPPGFDLPAYGRVLLDVLSGRSTLSIRGDEAEQAWRIVTPVLDGWAGGDVQLEEYPAGSTGPPSRADATPGDSVPGLGAGAGSQ